MIFLILPVFNLITDIFQWNMFLLIALFGYIIAIIYFFLNVSQISDINPKSDLQTIIDNKKIERRAMRYLLLILFIVVFSIQYCFLDKFIGPDSNSSSEREGLLQNNFTCNPIAFDRTSSISVDLQNDSHQNIDCMSICKKNYKI